MQYGSGTELQDLKFQKPLDEVLGVSLDDKELCWRVKIAEDCERLPTKKTHVSLSRE